MNPPTPENSAPAFTRVERPYAVTRVVTGRLIAEFNANGDLFIKSANGTDSLHKIVRIGPGESATATFKLHSKWHCGAAVFQPAGWANGCDGEMSLTLGNVDFPYLADSGYLAKDQLERFDEIIVTFVRDENGVGSIEGKVGGGTDLHEVRAMTPGSTPEKIGSHSVAFIAFSEPSAFHPQDMKVPKLHFLPSGGVVTLTYRDAAGSGSATFAVE